MGHLASLRDFLSQCLVPKLPAQALRHQLGDLASSASVFPFNGDDFDHTHAAFSETLDSATSGSFRNRSTATEIIFLKKE